ncbi:cytochrome P450 [Crepidotus variabilis]|uniref:Cytochrome P450 n=1 Tax=Crepidotus variabilis TaxID=179855 RepID=A0A9P6EKX9_9AGAR|nr:cytochrome P450 [Crepidotus variabilis]
MGKVPPGLIYLNKVLPYLLWPSLATYGIFRGIGKVLDTHAPTWFSVASLILARPVLTTLQTRYKHYQDRKAAESQGAVLAPHLPDSPILLIKAIFKSINKGYPGDLVDHFADRLGHTLSFDRLTSRTIITRDPDLVKAVLATQFESFEKGSEFIGQMDSILGNGIFNVDGEMWKFHRAMTRPFFTRERISDFEIYGRNCDLSLDLAKQRTREGEPIEFQDLASRFTLDAASEFLFGYNVSSLKAGIPYPPPSSHKTPTSFASHPSNVFVRAFTLAQTWAIERTALGNDWPLREFWKDTVSPLRKVMDDFTEPLMKESISKWEQEKAEGQVENEEEDLNLLAHLVRHTQDPKILQDELVNLLVAGRDTTAGLITFSLYMITQHPDVEQRLRQEILEKVGPDAAPAYASMRDMKYMRAFLNEVLRMYPPVPLNTRCSNTAILVPSKVQGEKPLYIPANTNVLYGAINIHRRKDLWGPDALEFDPMRFIDSRVNKYLTPNPYIFCPFNAGPRICLGQQFAYHEATFYLVRLLQRFKNFKLDDRYNTSPPAEWKTSTDGTESREKIHPATTLTLFIKGGLWVNMEEV